MIAALLDSNGYYLCIGRIEVCGDKGNKITARLHIIRCEEKISTPVSIIDKTGVFRKVLSDKHEGVTIRIKGMDGKLKGFAFHNILGPN